VRKSYDCLRQRVINSDKLFAFTHDAHSLTESGAADYSGIVRVFLACSCRTFEQRPISDRSGGYLRVIVFLDCHDF
jgi:hypothetical protein